MTAYASLVASMCRRFGVPAVVVHSFLKDEGATRPSEVTAEIAQRVERAMEAEDERLNKAW